LLCLRGSDAIWESVDKTMKSLPLMLLLALAPLCCRAQEAAAPPASPQPQQTITVNVLGAVNHASQFTVAKGATVIDAIAMAGDFNPYAASRKVKLIHKSAGAKPDVTIIDVKAMLEGSQKAMALRDGDTIYVPQSAY
jgi:protein involved in polysaccharide export with SLBB domain